MKKSMKRTVCLALTLGVGLVAGAQFTNVTVTEAPVAAVAETSNTKVGYADIYETSTKLVCAPTVLTEVKTAAELDLSQSETLPSTLILNVDDGLQVLNADGQPICSLDEAFDKIEKKCAIAVYIKNAAQADALAGYCKSNTAQDVFAVSADKDVLKQATTGYTYLLGILDIRGRTLTYGEACSEANLGFAKTVLADPTAFSYDDNRLLKALQISVWTQADTEKEVFAALYNNYTGIVTSDPKTVYTAYERITEKTLSDTSVFVGHRGSSGVYPENSVEAARYAVEQGVDAIEYDIHLTKDNQIVVMHDDDISTTTNGTGKISQMTLEEMSQYRLVGYGKTVKIPTLKDMLEAFKDEDVIHYIEYKANNPAMVEYVKKEIEAAGMEGKVLFISFFADVLTESQRQMPQISIGQLYGNFDTRDYRGAMEKAVSTFYANGKTNHCAYTYLYKQYIEVARHRGITANGYTFTDDKWEKYFLYDMGSLTLDRPETIGLKPLRVNAADMTVEEGETFTPSGVIATATTSFEGNCSLLLLGDGAEAFTLTDGGYTAVEAGTYDAVLSYEYDGTYSVLSSPFVITVAEKTAAESSSAAEECPDSGEAVESSSESVSESGETSAQTNESGGCGGALAYSGGLAIVGGIGVSIGKKRRREK